MRTGILELGPRVPVGTRPQILPSMLFIRETLVWPAGRQVWGEDSETWFRLIWSNAEAYRRADRL